MSIYIQDVDIPSEYPICLMIWPDGKTEKYAHHVIGEIQGECKAIQVPPHGRLGDLDALAGQFTPDDLYYPTEEDRRDYDNHSISMRDAREVIEMAPTIIPADQI